ncbi:MAG: hypothetical protein ACPG8W_07880 [Candidatus Promineifilaceae bacterium]
MSTHNSTQYTTRWQQRAGIWIGIGINPASITLGGGLASRLPLSALWWLMPLGAAILCCLAGSCGVIARRRREPFAKWSVSTFGLGAGALLLNVMMATGMMGWSGFQLGLAGTSLANILSLRGWMGIVLLAVAIFVFSGLGVNRWNRLVWVTTTASLALVLVALAIVGGNSAETIPSDTLTLSSSIYVIGSIISFAALFSLRSSDFAWDLQSDRDVWMDAGLFFVVLTISMFVGALLYNATGSWNLDTIMAATPYAVLGQVFIIISLLSATLSTLHSGSLALAEVVRIPPRVSAAIFLMVGTGLGITRFDRRLLPFLEWIGAATPPAIAVMIAYALLKRPLSSRLMLTAWLVGAGVAVVFKLNGGLVHLAAGAATSLLVLAIGTWMEARP